ncbi:3-methyl-2-oxobutanoate hydroxymethyltransferase [Blastococcus sp. Marseille-P5729]|uniref:3-methyl-2-oxobutanoate hydroxymethyltransferase n=1 Tax=Blastococcus sp. Marseille-P5729 TaxID=2086582 RepID=UPI000D0F03BC|nr:3-methyl-2-oxobutanoate hydroxymethyltransferase [Blastococcus sp. Marseille-P5729]
MARRTSIADIARMHAEDRRITMITAYDYTSAALVERSGIDMILVGDSLGMVMQGRDSTLPVTVDDIIYHTKMVMRGAQRPLVISDLPFMAYAETSDALRNAGRLMAEAGCQSVKLEGGASRVATIKALIAEGVPVMGHLGFTPQSVNTIGMKVQAREADAAAQLMRDALALQEAGCWAVVFELIPAPLAKAITERLDVPTIGIGAGPDTSGQVQVWHDLLGLYEDFVPRHTRRYRTLADEALGGLDEYAADVRSGAFPTDANSSKMDDDVLAAALAAIDDEAGR